MREAAFAVFHQVEVTQTFLVFLLTAFSGACCLKNARGTGTCGLN